MSRSFHFRRPKGNKRKEMMEERVYKKHLFPFNRRAEFRIVYLVRHDSPFNPDKIINIVTKLSKGIVDPCFHLYWALHSNVTDYLEFFITGKNSKQFKRFVSKVQEITNK